MNSMVLKFKQEDIINDFGTKDEKEIGRAGPYAVFSELKELVDQQKKRLTVQDLRASLSQRGVSDPIFQNKILSLILQNRAGIQFGLGLAFATLFTESTHPYCLNSNYDISIEVKNSQQVKLVYTANWQNITKQSRATELGARVEIDITPNRVAIDQCIIAQISDSPEAKAAFDYLNANQVNIIHKIILFLMNYFQINSDIEIENVYYDKTPWNLNNRKYEPLMNNQALNVVDNLEAHEPSELSEINEPAAGGLSSSLTMQ